MVKNIAELLAIACELNCLESCWHNASALALFCLSGKVIVKDVLVCAKQLRVVTKGCIGFKYHLRYNTIGVFSANPLLTAQVNVCNHEATLNRRVSVNSPCTAVHYVVNQLVGCKFAICFRRIICNAKFCTREAVKNLLISRAFFRCWAESQVVNKWLDS